MFKFGGGVYFISRTFIEPLSNGVLLFSIVFWIENGEWDYLI